MTESNGANAPTELDIEAARWFFQNSVDIFLLVRGGAISRINPAWTELTGWAAEETIGRSIDDFIHADDKETVHDLIARLIVEGHARAEHRLLRKDGGYLWMRSCVKRGSDGGAIVVLEDVTHEHQRAARSADAARTNDLLREAAGVFIWRFDPDTGLYDIDPDLSKAGDRGASGSRTITGQQMNDEVHPDDQKRMGEALYATLVTGEPQVIEYRHFRAEDGGWARLRAAWRGLRKLDSGRWAILGLTQDVSEVAEARDAAIEAAEAKAQFLANMSHEIRTPMNGVLGVLHLLRKETLSDDGRRLLDEAVGCGQMLAELLNDVIDFSKIEAGRLEFTPEAVDPAALLASVAGLLRPQTEVRDLWLNIHVEPDLGWASVDPVRVRQILFNLIGNAVKFTETGGVDARVRRVEHPDGSRLRFEIADTGVGIAADDQADLFQRFHQADGSTTRRFGGSGLGLAISRRLAELMGGEVGFESQAGQGSTFWMEIVAPTAAPRLAETDEAEALLDGLRVLVVEDNPTNRMIATRLLEELGASVETAEDGLKGVEAAQRSAFDMVFMDIQMPVMDGVEATRRIRSLTTPIANVPIVAMTANALSHQTDAYLAAGMTGFVSKPLSPTALVAQIAAVLAAPDAAAAAA
ncbi:MAG: ATP-binding protein [Caulobacter sp.]|nr:ATP-binding protein [Caulobacter sp.]